MGVFFKRQVPHFGAMQRKKFHGRFEDTGRGCEHPGCLEPGEFRAPGNLGASFDGPGTYRWFCLEHVRHFNSDYNWFEGMNAEEIFAAQSPLAGWNDETRAFSGDPSNHGKPRWSDFLDPLDAIGERAESIKRTAHRGAQAAANGAAQSRRFTAREQEALRVMGLNGETDRAILRRRYSELVRKYHPDRNGGDRKYEGRLQLVVEAYQVLRRCPTLA